jgi:hypothetical protein
LKIKTSLFIDAGIWREIKKAAIDCGKTVGDFVTMLFARWKEGQRDNRDTADQAGSNKDRQHRG